jgi:putrescine transport system permease protein
MGVTPEINALATIMIAIVCIGVVAAMYQMRRQAKLTAQFK